MTPFVELPKSSDERSGYAIKATHVLLGGQQLCTKAERQADQQRGEIPLVSRCVIVLLVCLCVRAYAHLRVHKRL